MQQSSACTTFGCVRITAVLLLAFGILGIAAQLRPPEYDEAYSIFLTAGDPRPAWPAFIFQPGSVRGFYTGNPSAAQIARDLRQDDVHPPLYFWLLNAWRRCLGPGWFAARMLSVCLSVAGLAGIAWIARRAEIPATAAVLIALLSYGFAYTGIVARGFALAQTLNILGIALILAATRQPARGRACGQTVGHTLGLSLTAGLAFGAAAFSNYLAVFIGVATLFWLCLDAGRRKFLLPACLGLAAFLPAILAFFLAQRNTRIGQFQPFSLAQALPRLAKDFGAALFGGLPVYAGRADILVTGALLLFTICCIGFILKNWRPSLSLFALAVLSVPAGLLALGLIFNNTPIEIRYLAFATPFTALLLAGTLPPAWRYFLLAIQSLAIIGLAIAPATQQPQARAARQLSELKASNPLVLLPFGNDGVGIPGPFIAAAPDNLRLQLITASSRPDLAAEHQLILVPIGIDAASKRATAKILRELKADPCWSPAPGASLLRVFIRSCETH